MVQGYEVPFLTCIKLLSTVDRYVYLCRIGGATVSIHLMIDAILWIDTRLEGNGTTLDVRVLSQQLPAEAVHDFRTVQSLFYRPMITTRGCLHLAQHVIDTQFCGTQRLAGFLHRLLIDGLARIVEHDKESGDEKHRHESYHPHNDLSGKRMARLFLCQSLHRVQRYNIIFKMQKIKGNFCNTPKVPPHTFHELSVRCQEANT